MTSNPADYNTFVYTLRHMKINQPTVFEDDKVNGWWTTFQGQNEIESQQYKRNDANSKLELRRIRKDL